MGAEAIVAAIAAAIAAAALYFSKMAADAAKTSAEQATKQTEIQKQIQVDAAQPYVWADIRPDEAVGTLLNLWIGNSGPTVATNVRIQIDPGLPAIAQLEERARGAQAVLDEGIASLAPGRTYSWPLGQGFNLLHRDDLDVRFTVTADGPFGPVPELNYLVRLGVLRDALDRPTGSLHELTRAVKELGKGGGRRPPEPPSLGSSFRPS